MKDNIKSKIKIDKENVVPIASVKQGDDLNLEINLVKDNKPFTPSGQTVRVGARLPNNAIQEQSGGIVVSGDKLTIQLMSSIISMAGMVEIDVEFKDANGVTTSSSFYIEVIEKTLNNTAVEATDYIDRLETLIINFTEDYESLKRVIIDENVAINLQNGIDVNKADINTLDGKVNQNIADIFDVNVKSDKNAYDIKDINDSLPNFIKKDGSVEMTGNLKPMNSNTLELGGSSTTWKDAWVGSVSKADNGYCKLTNGMIMQWGRAGLLVGENAKAVNLPTTFPGEFLKGWTNWNGDASTHHPQGVTSIRPVNNSSGTCFLGYTTTRYTEVEWFAIGY